MEVSAKASHAVHGWPYTAEAFSHPSPASLPTITKIAWPPIQVWMPNQPQAMNARSSAARFAPRMPKKARANTGKGMPYLVPAWLLSSIGPSTSTLPMVMVRKSEIAVGAPGPLLDRHRSEFGVVEAAVRYRGVIRKLDPAVGAGWQGVENGGHRLPPRTFGWSPFRHRRRGLVVWALSHCSPFVHSVNTVPIDGCAGRWPRQGHKKAPQDRSYYHM